MTNPPGSFVWYELVTPDPAAAAAFYGAVVGWTCAVPDMGGAMPYGQFTRSSGIPAGGILPLTEPMRQMGARPGWLPYLSVADVPAALAAITQDGGTVVMPPTTIPLGTFALVTEPSGAPLYVIAPVPPPDSPDATSQVFAAETEQAVCWNELASTDLPRATAFFARHFGFAFNETMPMGEFGDYCFVDHHGQRLGGMMPQSAPGLGSQWTFYFGVPSVRAAQQRIAELGGKVLIPAHPVPGGGWIVLALDPQGALFGVAGPEGE